MTEVIRIRQGRLAGLRSADGQVNSYRGIPFARPPLGPLRWRAPQAPAPWDGVRRAHAPGPIPIQPKRAENALTFLGHEPMSEDCLYLNVWAPAAESGAPRPVMVWLYFGAFLMGSGSAALFDGEALARSGAIVVTFNFRLGRLGFLAHPELSAEAGTSGNYGLLDQIAALRWVQENISAFGGDPDRVTLFGQSSGSSSVSLLMASPLAKGLFHRAIAQSGGEFWPPERNKGLPGLSSLRDAEEQGAQLAAELGETSIEGLRRRPADDILSVWTTRAPVNWRQGIRNPAFICSYPVVDGHVVPARGVFETFAAGEQNDVPLITGFTANEGAGKIGVADRAQFLRHAQETYGDKAAAFLQLFPAATDEAARRASSVEIGDRLFCWHNWTFARMHGKSSRHPTYFYHFPHVPPYPKDRSYAETDGDPATELGAIHGSEIPYVFGNLDKRDWPWRPEDRRLSALMSSYWLNFARTGDPNGSGLPAWPRFRLPEADTMFFEASPRVAEAPFRSRLAFWDLYFHGVDLS